MLNKFGNLPAGGSPQGPSHRAVKLYMDEYGIPDELQADVIKIFMDSLAVDVLKLAAKRKGLVVADTRGTLKGQKHWIDEIHPDTMGFKKIAKVVYGEMISPLLLKIIFN